ncbi:MAG: hypothetical protein Q9226_001478 [Calogaya cf. arnoldii]
MVSATDTAVGINELVSAMLAFLPRKDLKTARLVNRKWASLGGQMLIGTLYISPREIDMAAFEGITKQRDLAKSVRDVVFDSAQFFNFGSIASYIAELCLAHEHGAYLHLGDAHANAAAAAAAAIGRSKELKHRDEHDNSNLTLFNENICHESFIEGFLNYSLHFQERGNILRPSWFDRVVRGLKLIRPIESVAMRNTWNDIYDFYIGDNVYEDQDIDPQGSLGHEDYQLCRSCVMPVNRDDPDMRRLVNSGRIQADGRRLVGSPSARAYTPTGLQPFSPKPMESIPAAVHLLENGLSDGQWEFVKIVELLHASGQKPLHLKSLSDIESLSGIPTLLFSIGGPLNADAFLSLADNLKSIRLTLESDPPNAVEQDLQLLAQFLRKAITLQTVTLQVPDEHRYDVGCYRLSQIFSPIEQWIRPTLTILGLTCFDTGYDDLSRLLFFSLPEMKHLRLGEISLLDGIWEDIVEGLRQLVSLRSCSLENDLLHFNGKPYMLNDDSTTEEEIEIFLEANGEYIMNGGTHPRYPMYVPSQEFKEKIVYWKQLRGEQKEAQDSG